VQARDDGRLVMASGERLPWLTGRQREIPTLEERQWAQVVAANQRA